MTAKLFKCCSLFIIPSCDVEYKTTNYHLPSVSGTRFQETPKALHCGQLERVGCYVATN